MSSSVRASADTMHPMVVQMDNIRGYVAQARAAGRRDEAAMLEENLRELQLEYGRMVREERAAAIAAAALNHPPDNLDDDAEAEEPEYHGVNPFDDPNS